MSDDLSFSCALANHIQFIMMMKSLTEVSIDWPQRKHAKNGMLSPVEFETLQKLNPHGSRKLDQPEL